ncbi:helix-turn-helix domain-containing protein [Psychromarinibacter sediminicola]|nr:helix-turn-helix domain-containing protein [Psychromarinibacter sediminicola]
MPQSTAAYVIGFWWKMAHPPGFEPGAFAFGGQRSINCQEFATQISKHRRILTHVRLSPPIARLRTTPLLKLFHDLPGLSSYAHASRCPGVVMMEGRKYLTAEEVAERYRQEISVGTLRNWRAMRVGPPYVKVGKAVLYPVQELDEWDRTNLVICRASQRLDVTDQDEQ